MRTKNLQKFTFYHKLKSLSLWYGTRIFTIAENKFWFSTLKNCKKFAFKKKTKQNIRASNHYSIEFEQTISRIVCLNRFSRPGFFATTFIIQIKNKNFYYIFELIFVKYLDRMSLNKPESAKLGIGGLISCPRGNATFKYISSYNTQPRDLLRKINLNLFIVI